VSNPTAVKVCPKRDLLTVREILKCEHIISSKAQNQKTETFARSGPNWANRLASQQQPLGLPPSRALGLGAIHVQQDWDSLERHG